MMISIYLIVFAIISSKACAPHFGHAHFKKVESDEAIFAKRTVLTEHHSRIQGCLDSNNRRNFIWKLNTVTIMTNMLKQMQPTKQTKQTVY